MRSTFAIATIAIVALGSLVAGSTAARASSEQFQFQVPISFKNVPRDDVSDSKVVCEVFSDETYGEAARLGGKGVPALSGFIDPNRAESNMTVYVKFDADAGKDPTTATHYRCFMELRQAGETCRPHEVAADGPEWCRSHAEGDVLLVQGALN